MNYEQEYLDWLTRYALNKLSAHARERYLQRNRNRQKMMHKIEIKRAQEDYEI